MLKIPIADLWIDDEGFVSTDLKYLADARGEMFKIDIRAELKRGDRKAVLIRDAMERNRGKVLFRQRRN
jgi:hypothetical protein